MNEILIPKEDLTEILNILKSANDDKDVCVAIEIAINRLKKYIKEPESKDFIFSVSVFYNIGLGNQIKELPQIKAKSLQEAQLIAEKSADKIIGEEKWKEVKIRPIMAV